jgi:RNA polymerase sigma-70 factor (ECF subfamily)
VEWNDEVAGTLAPDGEDPAPAGPGVEMERGELRGALARAIEQLPEEARRTLLLREVDGLSYAEIAQALGIPKGTVMSRLHHARRRVRQLLVEAGVVEADREGPRASGDRGTA